MLIIGACEDRVMMYPSAYHFSFIFLHNVPNYKMFTNSSCAEYSAPEQTYDNMIKKGKSVNQAS